MSIDDRPRVEVRSIDRLRDWLSRNHSTSESAWLVTCKKAQADYLPWGDVVEELICWGWIDSTVRSVDEMRLQHRIAPRKETSAWSAVNKSIVTKMRKAGRMQPSGEAKIAAAKANGMWRFLDDVDRLEVPEDLATALGAARESWESWSRSVKRTWLEQIKRAKTAPTRKKRINACAEAARSNAKRGGLG